MSFSSYYLAKWSAYVRSRDGMTCQMCQRKCLTRREVREELAEIKDIDLGGARLSYSLILGFLGEAHHILPKAVFPLLVYFLWNGICLCHRCHRRIVHKTWLNWKLFYQLFNNIARRRKKNREYNEKHQHRVQPK